MMKLGDGKVVRPPAPIYTSLEGAYGLQLNQAMTGLVSLEEALFENILHGNQMIPYGVASFDDTLDNTKALIASLSGTYRAMIATLRTLAIPFSVWLLKRFMDEAPLDLEEAAWVAMLPPMIIFLLLGRYVVRGLTFGAVKG